MTIVWWYPVVTWCLVIAATARSLLAAGVRIGLPGGPGWLPLVIGGLAMVPVSGLPIGRWLHGFIGSMSIPFAALLLDDVLSPLLRRPLLDDRSRLAGAWHGAVASMLLYPWALGLGPFDPYAMGWDMGSGLGWRTPGVAGMAACAGVALVVCGNRFGAVLIASGAAWQAGLLESDNAWDYLVDPLYGIIATITLLGRAVTGRLARSPAVTAVLAMVCLWHAPATVAATDTPDERQLAEQWLATATALQRRATQADLGDLGALIGRWEIPAAAERIVVIEIPSRPVVPESIDTPPEQEIWDDFLSARRRRSEGLFALALEAARAHAAKPEMQPRSSDAVRLLALALREDPDNARARKAGGWVKRGDAWVWPEAARRIDKGEEWSAELGWLPRTQVDRARAGERYERGRWVRDDDAESPRPLDRAWTFATDHWQIRSTATREHAALLARELEETHAIWLQVFGGFQLEPAELERQFEGRGRVAPRSSFAAVLTANRQQYVAEMSAVEPLVGQTLGIYWTPTRTSWFFVGEERTPTTVHHEATHQLFGEMRKTSPLVGERCGFWAVEAAACFMESLERTEYGWTVGGIDAGRVPAARQRLVEDGFYVPLEELTALGRREFQADERLPRLYSQIAGLADFFMTGRAGRYREAFVEYLSRVYTGTADPDTLARLCTTDYATLDDEYRRHLSR
ncbi:MAG: hypothetical protein ACKOYJ_10190 [Planctomycetia bacterium]